eukprot:1158896-Pelagomonas_calceolata.AAC.1
MLFADQNLLAPHLTAAGHDFHFTDAERDAKLGGENTVCWTRHLLWIRELSLWPTPRTRMNPVIRSWVASSSAAALKKCAIGKTCNTHKLSKVDVFT